MARQGISSVVTGRASNTSIVAMIRFARSQFGVVPKKGELVRLAFDLAEEYLSNTGMIEREMDEDVSAAIVSQTYSGEIRLARETKKRELISNISKSYARQMQEKDSFSNQLLDTKIQLEHSAGIVDEVEFDYSRDILMKIEERDRKREEERLAMVDEAKTRGRLLGTQSGIVVESEVEKEISEEERLQALEEAEGIIES